MRLKNIISAATAACILAGSCITPAAVCALDLYGDVNLDNSVDVADAVMIARYYVMDWGLHITDAGKELGDVNRDGNLDDKDLKQVLEYIARKRTVLGTAEQQTEQQYQAVKLTDSVDAETVSGQKATQEFIDSQIKLAVDLFKGAAQDPQSDGEDVLISPLSVSQALAMTTNGANGQTKEEMEKLLGDGLDADALNQYYYDYTARLTEGDNAALHLANSVWFKQDDQNLSVPDLFLKTVKNYYHAEAFAAPFDDSTVVDINSWVNYHTHGMIPTLIDHMDTNWLMMLINALAFEAEWAHPYTHNDILANTFHAYDGDMTVEMMFSSESTYLHDDSATGFIKPYKDGKFSFAAILPNEGVTLSDYIGNMTPESLQAILNSKSSEEVRTKMPKFKHDYSITMNEMLKKLGMQRAFSDIAEFDGLNEKGNTCIDSVIHKTFVQVDERGTKAGAVTAVIMAQTAAISEPPQPKYVYLDRPFIYMILDNETGLPFFIGYVLHPTASDAE